MRFLAGSVSGFKEYGSETLINQQTLCKSLSPRSQSSETWMFCKPPCIGTKAEIRSLSNPNHGTLELMQIICFKCIQRFESNPLYSKLDLFRSQTCMFLKLVRFRRLRTWTLGRPHKKLYNVYPEKTNF